MVGALMRAEFASRSCPIDADFLCAASEAGSSHEEVFVAGLGPVAGSMAEFGCEDGQGAADEPDGTVGMAAGPAPVDLAKPALQRRQVGGAAFGEPLDFPCDGVEAEEAPSQCTVCDSRSAKGARRQPWG
jgi:hypothetical protein